MLKFKVTKNLLFRWLIQSGRVLTVAIAILSLLATGASAITRLTKQPVAVQADVTELIQEENVESFSMVGDPDEAPDGMATDSKPWSEPSALLQSISITFSGSNQYRFKQTLSSFGISKNSSSVYLSDARFSKTFSEVLWSLGRQFTLVGAKPSGTS